MEFDVFEAIRGRRSVRTYSTKPIRAEDMRKLESYISGLKNPFGVPAEFRFLDAKRQGLSSPVVVGTDTYLGAKVPKVPNCEAACGYDFESVVLYAQSLGIGTVWIAGTMNRPAFEKAMDVSDTELMPAVTPIGYPAEKMSVRETLMRKGVKANERLPFETLFFSGNFDSPLSAASAWAFGEALEAVRLAPSAVNKQPWRIVICGNTAHFFEKKSKGMAARQFDVQKVDIGIALCHFALALESRGVNVSFSFSDPQIATGEDAEYIVSCTADI